jgi:hypothetical protein
MLDTQHRGCSDSRKRVQVRQIPTEHLSPSSAVTLAAALARTRLAGEDPVWRSLSRAIRVASNPVPPSVSRRRLGSVLHPEEDTVAGPDGAQERLSGRALGKAVWAFAQRRVVDGALFRFVSGAVQACTLCT